MTKLIQMRMAQILVQKINLLLFPFFLLLGAAAAQSTGSIQGRVVDETGAGVARSEVLLVHLMQGFERRAVTNEEGRFLFSNLPIQSYELVVAHPGFSTFQDTIAVQSNVPIRLEVRLTVAALAETVDVRAFSGERLLETGETGTRNELSLQRIEQLPIQVGSRGVEALLVSFPGFAKNANGAIHPRGAHNQMTYVIDGMPISDQLTGSFATALDASIIETLELYTGNIPPEYGSKVSGVASITTRSGLGSGAPFRGSVELGGASFDTLSSVSGISGGGDRFGYFISTSLLKSNRFLDQVSLDNLHNGGNSQRIFNRFDFRLSDRQQLRANLMAGRSSFQVANLRSQHAAGQDQRRLLKDFSASIGWLYMLNDRTTVDTTVSYRTAVAFLHPSLYDTPVWAAANRHLSTVTTASRLNMVRGSHVFRLGFDHQRIPISESFSFGITEPLFNDPTQPHFNPSLVPHDLSRGGELFHYSGKEAGDLWTGWLEDKWTINRFTLSLGFRYDVYRFLVNGNQLQPRVGMAYHLPATRTVFRLSYNRNYQTPPNENLILANSYQAATLVPPAVREALGDAVLKIRPQRQNVYEVGVQQAVGDYLSLNGVFYHKNSTDLQDNDNFFNTGIIFPTSLYKSRVNGIEFRGALLPYRGWSGSVSVTHGRVVATPPFTGGLFLGNAAVEALTSGAFIIDHDQVLSVHGLIHRELHPDVWISSSMRYDSGLVSNPSDPEEVAQDPDYADLLPYVDLLADPPRVNPRFIVDVAVGYGPGGDDRKWDLQFQVSNLFNQTALYNFQSIFVGTRLVPPRSLGLKLRFLF